MIPSSFNSQLNTLRHSTSRETIAQCQRAYADVRPQTAQTAAAAQHALDAAQHATIGRQVDTFLLEPSHAKRAELAIRLLRRNFESDSPLLRPYEITVRQIDRHMRSADFIYPTLAHFTRLWTGGDELNDRYSAQARRLVQMQLHLVPDISEDVRRGLIDLADECAKDVYDKIPSTSAPIYALRRSLSDEDIALLLRLPNQDEIALGQRRLDARVVNDQIGKGARFAVAGPADPSPNAEPLDASYALFLDAIGIRKTMSAVFSQQALALGTEGASDLVAKAVDAQLLRDKTLLRECFQNIDVAAYQAFMQIPRAPDVLDQAQKVLTDSLSTWNAMAQMKFQQEFAKQVAAQYEGRYL